MIPSLRQYISNILLIQIVDATLINFAYNKIVDNYIIDGLFMLSKTPLSFHDVF